MQRGQDLIINLAGRGDTKNSKPFNITINMAPDGSKLVCRYCVLFFFLLQMTYNKLRAAWRNKLILCVDRRDRAYFHQAYAPRAHGPH